MSRFRLSFSVVLAMAALVLSVGSVSAANTPFNANLVKNPGAEAGSNSNDGSVGVPIPHWEGISDSHFTVVPYGATNFPTKAEGNRIGGGKQFFTAGTYDTVYGECDDVSQSIFLTGLNSKIDGHHVKVVLSAWVATFDSQTDNAIVRMTIGDDSNNFLGTLKLPTQTATNGKFKHLTASKVLPAKTRELTVKLQETVHQGNFCDAYFDNISVKLVQV